MNKKQEKTLENIEILMTGVMQALEIPVTDSNKDTPYRVAKMWINELFANRNNHNIEELNSKMKVFDNQYQNDMVILRDIHFNSMCEHHWLPFSGKVIVGYLPGEKVIGLSKIPRVVRYFSKKPQLQEQLGKEIGQYLMELLNPIAIFVRIEAEHGCVKCRGVESDCSTVTLYENFQQSETMERKATYKNTFFNLIRGC